MTHLPQYCDNISIKDKKKPYKVATKQNVVANSSQNRMLIHAIIAFAEKENARYIGSDF